MLLGIFFGLGLTTGTGLSSAPSLLPTSIGRWPELSLAVLDFCLRLSDEELIKQPLTSWLGVSVVIWEHIDQLMKLYLLPRFMSAHMNGKIPLCLVLM